MMVEPEASSSSGGSSAGRGEFIASVAASIGLALSVGPDAATATVNFETERYGDKELKIATVNKLRQQIRNSVRASIGIKYVDLVDGSRRC